MRVRLPKKVSEKLKLKGKDILDLELEGTKIHITKPTRTDLGSDPVIRDMVERPMHSEIKVTSELLEKLKEEMWYG